MIRVMIVDDHGLVRTGIQMLLKDSNNMKVVAVASNGLEAIKKCSETQVDVCLMDIMMPGMNGLVATEKLLRKHPDMKIIVVSVCESDIYATKFLTLGAHGFVTKSTSPEEMMLAIRKVYTGQRYISPEIANKLAMKQINDDSGSPFETLSERELQVTLMVTKGVDVKTIADQLCLSTKTVNSYRYRIFEKLGIDNDVELTLLAIRHGLIEVDEKLSELETE